MARTYKLTPVDNLPGRRQNSAQRSVYLDVLDDVLKSRSDFLRVEVPGPKPASIAAGLKEAIKRDPGRYGTLSVRQRGSQIYLERGEAARQGRAEQKAA